MLNSTSFSYSEWSDQSTTQLTEWIAVSYMQGIRLEHKDLPQTCFSTLVDLRKER